MMWHWRVVVIVPVASLVAAESSAREVNSTGPDYPGDAFTTPLSSDGDEPATHYALYTSATGEMIERMSAALPGIEGAMFWTHEVDGRLIASNVTESSGQPWGWNESIAAAGLSLIRPTMP